MAAGVTKLPVHPQPTPAASDAGIHCLLERIGFGMRSRDRVYPERYRPVVSVQPDPAAFRRYMVRLLNLVGDKPLVLVSGYRSPQYNQGLKQQGGDGLLHGGVGGVETDDAERRQQLSQCSGKGGGDTSPGLVVPPQPGEGLVPRL